MLLATAAKDVYVAPSGRGGQSEAARIESFRLANNSTNSASVTIYCPLVNDTNTAAAIIYPAIRMAANQAFADDVAIPLAPGERFVAFASTTNVAITIYGTEL